MAGESHWDIWDREHRGESQLRDQVSKERSADKLAASIRGALGAGVPTAAGHGSAGSVVHVSTKADFKRAAPVKGEKDPADSMRTKIRMAAHYRGKRGENVNDTVDARTPRTEQKVNPHEGGAARSADKIAAQIKKTPAAPATPKMSAAERAAESSRLKVAAPAAGQKAFRTGMAEDHQRAADQYRQLEKVSSQQSVRRWAAGRATEHEAGVHAADTKATGPSDEQRAAHYRMVADRAQNLSRGASTAEQHHAAATQQRRAAELAPTGALRAGHGKIADNHAQSELVERRAEAAKASADAQQRAGRAARSAEQQRESDAARAWLAARQAGTLERQGGAQAGSNWHVLSERAEIATGRADRSPTRENHQAASDVHMAASNAARGIDDQASMHHQDMAGRHQVVVDSKGRSRSTGKVGSMGASAERPTAAPRSADKLQERADEMRRRTTEQEIEAVKAENPGVRLDAHRAASGHIVVSQIVVPSDRRSQGVGGRIMKRLTDAADRNGDSMALTPSKDYGGTVSRLQTFYKGHGFVPNSGRNKDFTTKESMVREPRPKA